MASKKRKITKVSYLLLTCEYCFIKLAGVNLKTTAERRTMDGNEAAADVAYRLNEIFAIYPITPSSPMAEFADEWSAAGRKNLWGTVPRLVEMQSEGGAAGSLHGSLMTGAMASTFTASQGLLLMIPNMYKIAGELTPFCMHVTARALATHALSIFGDHSDVMACRQTGFALLCSGSVQESHDFSCLGQAATLRSRIPFLHFFDGFRTSHELNSVQVLDEETLRAMVDEKTVEAHRQRALTPDRPTLRGTAQNPDVFFQCREAINPFYAVTPEIVQELMDQFAALTGRQYRLFEYHGHPEAEEVTIVMGSGGETMVETVRALNKSGAKQGVLLVRLYRPFAVETFLASLPNTVRRIAVLDRTKEPGAPGEPLYLDVVAALRSPRVAEFLPDAHNIKVIGGRYGLGSKEFNPPMAKAVCTELANGARKNGFTVGIEDDISGTSLKVEEEYEIEPPERVRAVFFGLGSDGTVGANKNTLKIVADCVGHHAQGYFVYDSKKAGAVTISHLRFGEEEIRAPWLLGEAEFVGCHQPQFLDKLDILKHAKEGATVLLNLLGDRDNAWERLPREFQAEAVAKKIRLYGIDAYKVARDAGMGGRINTVMQTAFFAVADLISPEQAIQSIKDAIHATYRHKGARIVEKNNAAVDGAVSALYPIELGEVGAGGRSRPPAVAAEAPEFTREVQAVLLANEGDRLPVSAFPPDGVWPTDTARWEKRNLAREIPVWDSSICIQCNKCAMVCPHAAIRPACYDPQHLEGAPDGFMSVDFKSRDMPGLKYTLQVAPEDCTGCTLCVQVCPAKNKANPRLRAINMEPQEPLLEKERENYSFFLELPEPDATLLKDDVKHSQFRTPLFEYSGACAGCGETPYVKLLTQLFGDRLLVANATGCSSIYGGNLPTTPFAKDKEGRGPAWANSLFEDNAEFGLGFRLTADLFGDEAARLSRELSGRLGDELVQQLVSPVQGDAAIKERRNAVVALRERLQGDQSPEARRLGFLADYLVPKSVWVVGGDGWAYDIGYGGLDHVLASGHNVNILVLDTEVYSNTGGQQSKSTPMSASAKFSIAGKSAPKKDLGWIATGYGNAYVARIAMGARDIQTVQVLREAEEFPGPSIVIAYSHCIAHGYNMTYGLEQQKLAVQSGHWPLFRFDPRRAENGGTPMVLDSAAPKIPLSEYTANEMRFHMLDSQNPERAKQLAEAAQEHVTRQFKLYAHMAGFTENNGQNGNSTPTKS